VLKDVWVSAHARSHVICIGLQRLGICGIFSNICTAHAQKRLLMNFRCKFRHRRSIRRSRFPVRVQNFGDLATFSVDFCILYSECPPYFYFRFVWPLGLESIPHVDNSQQVWSLYGHSLPSYSVFVCWYVTWPGDLFFCPWTVVIRVQNFSDLATFSVHFYILYSESPPYFYFRFVWPTDLESIPHASIPTSIIPTKFEVDMTIHCRVIAFFFCWYVTYVVNLFMSQNP